MSGFEVMESQCDECLFGPNPIVSDRRRRQILADLKRKDSHFECHKGTLVDRHICCRADYDRNPMRTNLMRIAARLGVVRFVTPPEDRDAEPE